MIEFGHATHPGLHRSRNEDTYIADGALGLFLVADGMGGQQLGDVASATTRDTTAAFVAEGKPLIEAVHAINQYLLEKNRDGATTPMGSTIVALLLRGGAFELACVGDSRAYAWQGALRRIDHADTPPTPDRSRSFASPARRNALTQALGITPPEQLHIGVAHGIAESGSAFLLCSDGLTDCLDDDAIARLLTRNDLSAQECVDQLLLDALERGAGDNLTAVLVRIS